MSSSEGDRGSVKDSKNSEGREVVASSGSKLVRPRAIGAPSHERLPSVRPKRDLTLGGVQKKSFAPTIPTRRVKKEPVDESSSSKQVSSAQREGKKEKKKGGHGKERAGDKRRGKEIVTSASVFSMGPAERSIKEKRESISGTFGSTRKGSDDVKTSKDAKPGVSSRPHLDEPEDEELMDTHDVFDTFAHSRVPPICLPLDYTLHQKQRALPSKLKGASLASGGSVAHEFPEVSKPMDITAADLFNPTEPQKGSFLFLQLPDCLPLSQLRVKEEHMDVAPGGASAPPTKSSSQESAATSTHSYSTLRNVPEGHIGKLRVHKSGKVKLVLGNVTLDVCMGTACTFLQELSAVNAEQSPPELAVLGRLSHRLVCTPDLETMLNHSNHSIRE